VNGSHRSRCCSSCWQLVHSTKEHKLARHMLEHKLAHKRPQERHRLEHKQEQHMSEHKQEHKREQRTKEHKQERRSSGQRNNSCCSDGTGQLERCSCWQRRPARRKPKQTSLHSPGTSWPREREEPRCSIQTPRPADAAVQGSEFASREFFRLLVLPQDNETSRNSHSADDSRST
jgi:hypothetical protein